MARTHRPGPWMNEYGEAVDPWTGEHRILARLRRFQTCRSCRSTLSVSSFTSSRIIKRDYECRRCNTLRRGRERGYRPSSK